jgi:hypothetical protein
MRVKEQMALQLARSCSIRQGAASGSEWARRRIRSAVNTHEEATIDRAGATRFQEQAEQPLKVAR